MLSVCLRAAVVALPYSIVVGILVYYTNLYFIGFHDLTEQKKYAGFEAIEYMLKFHGPIGHLSDALLNITLVAFVSFFALIIQGFMYERSASV